MAKILVTGGSGFIGSNLVQYLHSKGHNVINYDKNSPRNKNSLDAWISGDILDKNKLLACFSDFIPEYVIHLAARTDLDENQSLEGYSANIQGVQNMIDIINGSPQVKRTVYASSRMVCRIDYIPESFDDFCPPNLYGESKMIGEKMVREKAKTDYVVVRPTSIWGPYFEIPYRTFFDTVKNNLFFLPKGHNPQKSFGFVGNTVYQLEQMLFAPKEQLEQNYYLSDYPALHLKEWANLVATELGVKEPLQIPMLPLKIAAKVGDALQKTIWKNPPLTTFRLNNLVTNMVYDDANLKQLCGALPYNIEDGVKQTVSWINNDNNHQK